MKRFQYLLVVSEQTVLVSVNHNSVMASIIAICWILDLLQGKSHCGKKTDKPYINVMIEGKYKLRVKGGT